MELYGREIFYGLLLLIVIFSAWLSYYYSNKQFRIRTEKSQQLMKSLVAEEAVTSKAALEELRAIRILLESRKP
jgi:hypothetical protein